jgi:hypothetical protein
MDNQLLVSETGDLIPLQVASAGAEASKRFVEFFTANIRNRNTRVAYARAVANFFTWCELRGIPPVGTAAQRLVWKGVL